MISGEDVTLIIRTDIIPKLPSRMFFTSCHGRFVFTTTDGWKNNPHGCFKTSVWGNVRQGILYLVMWGLGIGRGENNIDIVDSGLGSAGASSAAPIQAGCISGSVGLRCCHL